MHRINELFAFVVTEPNGDEGVLRREICDRQVPIGTQPMIADSRERLELFRGVAEEMAKDLGMELSVAAFTRKAE